MPTNVIMPQMGESIAEGTITRWLKKPGDTVKRDEPLFEISTDKVDAEIPAPASGVLLEILVTEGTTVAINTVVARLGDAAEAPAPQPVAVVPPPAPEPPPAVSEPALSAPAPAPVEPQAMPEPPRPFAVPASAPPQPGETREELQRRRSSPVVRAIAAEMGIDISQLSGTGVSGRVTREDILKHAAESAAGPAAPEPTPLPAPAAVTASAPAPVAPVPAAPPVVTAPPPQPVTEVPPAPPQAPAPVAVPIAVPQTIVAQPVRTAATPVIAYPAGGNIVVETMSPMRKKIAERMVESKHTSAHVTTVFEIDYTSIVKLRNRVKDQFFQQHGTKLTFMPFIFKAAIAALKARPVVNASLSNDSIVYHKDINLGMAVALDWGLIVPVIKQADNYSLVGLARVANDLAERARTKKLVPDEVQGGTFTITNPGVYGSLFGTPIINQPQVAILNIGAIEKRAKVVEMPDGNDAIAIKTMGYMALTFDHRLVDGAEADAFMNVVKETIETGRFSELE